MTRITPELAPNLQESASHQRERHLSWHRTSKNPHHTSGKTFVLRREIQCTPGTHTRRIFSGIQFRTSDPEAKTLTLGHCGLQRHQVSGFKKLLMAASGIFFYL
ncbi:hypothetical protein AVEN_101148-1 [Araneus ventricosus]|uniref:Uncharacterized protein n=1 Tax=Araneus ventricosus TaxID=182803 RepID=A0A4Y2DEJ8_ARAVE|nr:hypothetical protein AVEN_101148-1 [Araneus ventricosus]